MFEDYIKFLDSKLTRPRVVQTDANGTEHSSSTFPFFNGITLYSGIPYTNEKDLKYNLKMFEDEVSSGMYD